MAKNPYPGKAFEAEFKEGCINWNVKPIRLYDPMGRYKGVGNICDFIIYQFPLMFCFELKSTMGGRFPFSNMTDTQYEGMLEQVEANDAAAGLLIHFTERLTAETVYVPIKRIQVLKEMGKASISYEDAAENGVVLPSRLKRTKFEYSPTPLFFQKVRRCHL